VSRGGRSYRISFMHELEVAHPAAGPSAINVAYPALAAVVDGLDAFRDQRLGDGEELTARTAAAANDRLHFTPSGAQDAQASCAQGISLSR